jgi:hypothetical protein
MIKVVKSFLVKKNVSSPIGDCSTGGLGDTAKIVDGGD